MATTGFKGWTIIQANLHHCRAATTTLCRRLDSDKTTIALIQEPWVTKSKISGFSRLNGTIFAGSTNNKSPRTCIYIPKNIQASIITQISDCDLTAVQLRCDFGEGMTDVTFASIYLPIDAQEPPPSNRMVDLVNHCETRGNHLIIGCDANAHHTSWGSSDNNNRGECLFDFINTVNLEILNRGTEPTFVTSRYQTVIDITLASMRISNYIKSWHVSNELTMSDHRWLCFKLEAKKVEYKQYRNPRKTNKIDFHEYLAANLGTQTHLNAPYNYTTEDIDRNANHLQTILTSAYESSCPLLTARPSNKATPWWCRELDLKQRATRRLFNRAKNSRREADWEAYKSHQSDYKKTIRQKQREAWRTFCGDIQSTTTAARLKKAISKDPCQQPGSLKKGDGTYTSTLSEAAGLLIETHFPDCRIVPKVEWPKYEPQKPTREDWDVANHVVTHSKITWSINSFLPYKSPGPDGIYPALLQWGLDLIAHHLVPIFRACLALRYIPEQWRKVRVVFIPKPAKTDYSSARSFRPISLTSFFVKTLERLCDREIRDSILLSKPLHVNQHAYLPGRSTESALHQVVGRIERSLENKELTLGAFIDIEGAFDKATFESINTALREYGVAPAISGWIGNMLKWRVVQATAGDATIQGVVTKGCPQGGVLSPLLWNLVVDSLLQRLNNERYFTVGYADDITILLTGKFESVIFNQMQHALKLVEDWCNGHSLTANAAKTELVLFTRKRKVGNCKLPSLKGTPLRLAPQVKYLGVILDQKLNWRSHLEQKIGKARIGFWQCRRAVGRSWGLSPKITLWLYTAIIRPMLCYAALVWWPRTIQTTAKSKLRQVQRIACLSITGAMRSTPTSAMETLLSLPPLDLHVREMALRSALRLRDLGLWTNRRGIKGHTEAIEAGFKELPLLEFRSDRISPKHIFSKQFTCSLTTHDLDNVDIQIFTDGSKTESGSGAGIHSPELKLNISIPLGKHSSVFQTELMGILVCANKIKDSLVTERRIQILTDSKAAIAALNSRRITSGLVMDCITALNEVSTSNALEISWIKGHQGNEGNEKADELARQGSGCCPYGPEPILTPTVNTLHNLIKHKIQESHKHMWLKETSCRQGRAAIAAPSKQHTKYYLNLSRSHLRTITGIVTGHCKLNKHLYIQGLVNSPKCRGCNQEDETAEHVLCVCPAATSIRGSILGEYWPDMGSIRSTPPAKLLEFILKLGWLEE